MSLNIFETVETSRCFQPIVFVCDLNRSKNIDDTTAHLNAQRVSSFPYQSDLVCPDSDVYCLQLFLIQFQVLNDVLRGDGDATHVYTNR